MKLPLIPCRRWEYPHLFSHAPRSILFLRLRDPWYFLLILSILNISHLDRGFIHPYSSSHTQCTPHFSFFSSLSSPTSTSPHPNSHNIHSSPVPSSPDRCDASPPPLLSSKKIPTATPPHSAVAGPDVRNGAPSGRPLATGFVRCKSILPAATVGKSTSVHWARAHAGLQLVKIDDRDEEQV